MIISIFYFFSVGDEEDSEEEPPLKRIKTEADSELYIDNLLEVNVLLLHYAHGKHLWSCPDGQLT